MGRSHPSCLLTFLGAVVVPLAIVNADPGTSPVSEPSEASKPKTNSKPVELKRLPEGQVRSIFLKAAGLDKDSVLQGDEFNAAIVALSKLAELPERVKRAEWKAADKDADKLVDWFEFYAFVRQEPPDTRRLLDQNDAGSVASRRSGVLPPDVPLAEDYLRKHDADGDGVLTVSEFDAAKAEFDKAMAAYHAEQKAKEDKRWDVNGDGKAEQWERDAVMQREYEETLAEIAQSYDTNQNGRLDVDEAKQYRHNRNWLSQKNFDKDGDGSLNEEELADWRATPTGKHWSLFDLHDERADGVLDPEERKSFQRALGEEYRKEWEQELADRKKRRPREIDLQAPQ